MRGDLGFPVRVRFTKRGKVRFVSHRDVARAFERAFRIEQMPLAFTQGFSPRPKVSFGLALGVGHESVAEYLDVELAKPVGLDALPHALSVALPDGIDVSGVGQLVERAPALQEAVTAVGYELRFDDVDQHALAGAAQHAITMDSLEVTTTRKGREVVEDLRPALRRLTVTDDDQSQVVVAVEVSTQPRGIRPADLAAALRDLAGAPTTIGPEEMPLAASTNGFSVLRTHQWIERDGARHEPLEADRATHTAIPVGVSDKGLTNDRRDHTGGDHLRDPAVGDDAGVGDERRIA